MPQVEFVGGPYDGLEGDLPADALKEQYLMVDLERDLRYNYIGYLEVDPEDSENRIIVYLFEPLHYTIGDGTPPY